MIGGMLIVLVHVRVLPESVAKFRAATLANAAASRQEPGIAQFEAIQQADDPTRFVLIEVYRTNDAVAAHKETEHYKRWRDTVAPMMAEARVGVKYGDLNGDWK